MRIIICGTRSLSISKGKELIAEALKEIGWEPAEIISGGASGADTAAREYAKENGIDFAEFPANWKGKGKAAGYKRNQKMAWYAKVAIKILDSPGAQVVNVDRGRLKPGCIALWNGKSAGTKHMMDICKDAGIPVYTKLYHPQTETPEASS